MKRKIENGRVNVLPWFNPAHTPRILCVYVCGSTIRPPAAPQYFPPLPASFICVPLLAFANGPGFTGEGIEGPLLQIAIFERFLEPQTL